MKDQSLFEKAISWAQRKGFNKIKANIEEFETPVSYASTMDDKEFIPDLTCTRRGRKMYIEIATKTDNVRKRVSKYKLLSTLANMKGGQLFLLAPHGHKAFATRILEKHNISAKVVSI